MPRKTRFYGRYSLMKNRLILIFEVFFTENKYHREFQRSALHPRMAGSEKMDSGYFP